MKNHLQRLKSFNVKRTFNYALIRALTSVKVFLYKKNLSDNTPKLIDSKIITPTQFIGKGFISVNNAQLGVWPSPYFLSSSGYIEARNMEAKVYIGKETIINNNFSIIADRTFVQIGDRCLIGPNLFVVDSDFHGIELKNRRNGRYSCSPVVIGDDVFIGENVRILKGVVVGNGAVIGSGSIVTKNVDSYSVYSGAPAKFISKISI